MKLSEKKLFINSLIQRPWLILINAPSLINFIMHYCRIRSLNQFRRPHLGTKKIFKKTKIKNPNEIRITLPEPPNTSFDYNLNKIKPLLKVKPSPAENDVEDIFYKHRWNNLIDLILQPSESSAKQELDEILHWIKSHKNKSLPWWEPYSTSERIANFLLWATSCQTAKKALENNNELLIFLSDSTNWLISRLEYYGPKKTNNHFLNNARALIMYGSTISWHKCIQLGVDIVDYVLPILLHPSGMFRERSSHYQLLFCNWLLDIEKFLSIHEDKYEYFLKKLRATNKKVLEATSLLLTNKKNLKCFIGDISPDISPEKLSQRLKYYYLEALNNTTYLNRSIQLDDWYFIRKYEQEIILNCVAGKQPIKHPTHGHNDLTSFCWLYKQKLILQDSGRFRYTKSPLALHHISGYAHNVLLIDNLPPMAERVMGVPWVPRPYANIFVKNQLDTQSFTINHNGFSRLLGSNTKHKRTLILKENKLVVVDELQNCCGKHMISLLWHFSKEQFIKYDTSNNEIYYQDLALKIITTCNATVQTEWIESSKAIAYGQLISSGLLRHDMIIDLPCSIITEFDIRD